MEKKIRKIWLNLGNESSNVTLLEAKKEHPIECFLENGEMANVKWYRQGNEEYNGKYVIKIEYF